METSVNPAASSSACSNTIFSPTWYPDPVSTTWIEEIVPPIDLNLNCAPTPLPSPKASL